MAPKIRVAVDVGCNIGDWTAEVLRWTRGTCRVACVEPDPANAAVVRARFSGNELIRLYEAAVAEDVGTARFCRGAGRHSGAGHLATQVAVDDTTTIAVATTTLDQISKDLGGVALDLVKVDIEGAEMALLAGAAPLFMDKRIGVIQLEYNTTWMKFGAQMRQLFEFARTHGYSVLIATPVGFAHLPRYGIGLEDFRLRNLILARSDWVDQLKPFGPSGRARVEAEAP